MTELAALAFGLTSEMAHSASALASGFQDLATSATAMTANRAANAPLRSTNAAFSLAHSAFGVPGAFAYTACNFTNDTAWLAHSTACFPEFARALADEACCLPA